MVQSNVVSIERGVSVLGQPDEYIQAIRQETSKVSGFYPSLTSLLSANLVEPDALAYGIRRGEISQIAGVTNAGKSTVALNLSLALAANGIFPPFITKAAPPRRVLYIDFEATRTLFREHLKGMLQGVGNIELAEGNFIPCVDALVRGKPLDLSRRDHMNFITDSAVEARADLIVIDPIGVAFDLSNENNNAEVTKRVIKPLKILRGTLILRSFSVIISGSRRSHIHLNWRMREEGLLLGVRWQGRSSQSHANLTRAMTTLSSNAPRLRVNLLTRFCSS